MRKGKIVEWNDERGFGFIMPDDGGHKIFFHINDYPQFQGRPYVGQESFFETVRTDRSEKAVEIITLDLVSRRIQHQQFKAVHRRQNSDDHSGWWAVLFLAGVVLMALFRRVPPTTPIVYALASIFSILAYGSDKKRAEEGLWRISENTLHLMALLGGWPGALYAQRLYRHKTRKESFRAVFWFTVTANCAALATVSVFGLQATLLFIEGWARWANSQMAAH